MLETYRSPPFDLEGYVAFKVVYEDGSKATVLQHREVMEAILGRQLGPDEIVHHKNKTKTDNRPLNLKVTNQSAHARDHANEHPAELIEITCLECGKLAVRKARYVRHNQGIQKKAGPFCGRSCAGRFNARKQYG